MGLRIAFTLIVLFWLTMNVLLWRHEFYRAQTGSPVDVETVWQKILTAPDDSSLDILEGDEKIGFCQWAATVGSGVGTDELPNRRGVPEQMVQNLESYTLSAEGAISVGNEDKRARFRFNTKLSDPKTWERFLVRLAVKPKVLKVSGDTESERLRIQFQQGSRTNRWSFAFDALQDPEEVLRKTHLPSSFLSGMLPKVLTRPESLAGRLEWSARTDWLTLRNARVRVYRLEATLLARYKIVVVVSRVGEILRVDLPGRLRLINEALGFKP